MEHSHVASSLRGHRKRSGLEQKELARILGLPNAEQVSRHERGAMVPSLPVAFGYEVIFGVRASELFPRLYEKIRRHAEEQLAKLEYDLQQLSIQGRWADVAARKLEFLWERKNPASIDFDH
jgi:transcriptional regulator with XRE-family HTH domain